SRGARSARIIHEPRQSQTSCALHQPASICILPRPPRSTLFPYTTLFRSGTFIDWILENLFNIVDSQPVLGNVAHIAVRILRIVPDRKSTRLNSSHQIISYAVFCLKKKTDESTSSSLALTIVETALLTTRR